MRDPFNQNDIGADRAEVAKALLPVRIIWFAMLMGQLIFLAVVIFVMIPNHQGNASVQNVLIIVNIMLLVTSVPVTFFLRKMTFDRARTPEGGIPPTAYSTGNIIFWAGCEGLSFLGLITAALTGSLWPSIIFVAIAMAFQVATFPAGGRISIAKKIL